MTRVVGLAGYKRAGKDTVAARLIERHGFERFAFADPLKAAALSLDPIVETTTHEIRSWDTLVIESRTATHRRLSEVVDELGWERAKERREVRRTLQRLGVAIREIMPTFWVAALIRAVDASDAERVVITDVRFENEVDAVRSLLGGDIALVTRPGTSSDGHISEQLPDVLVPDFVFRNDDTIEALHEQVDAFANG